MRSLKPQTDSIKVGLVSQLSDVCVLTWVLICQCCPSVCAGQPPAGPLSIQAQDSWEMGSVGMEAGLLHLLLHLFALLKTSITD